MDDLPVVTAAGLRKPSPGFILPADGNLNALNNARIEVRPPLSVAGFRANAPLRAKKQKKTRRAMFSSISKSQKSIRPIPSDELPRPPLSSPDERQLFWPDDGMWYSAEVVSLNNRARSAKVLYATGDVETLSIDEIAAEGHLNVCDQ